MKVTFRKNKETTIHQRDLQVLMIEVYKVKNGYVPPIKENTNNLRNFQIMLNKNKQNSKIWLGDNIL